MRRPGSNSAHHVRHGKRRAFVETARRVCCEWRELRDHLARAANGGRAVRHPLPYPAMPMSLYYRAGVLADRTLGFRPPLYESVMFITADRVLDLSRARYDLGYEPQIDVATAAVRTVEFLRRENLLA